MFLLCMEKIDALIEKRNAAKSEVEKLRGQIAALQQQHEVAAATLAAFQAAVDLFSDAQTPKSQPTNTPTTRHRVRLPSENWQRVFAKLATKHPEPFNYRTIIDVATSNGIEINEGSLRARMMNMVHAKLATRVDAGSFRLTNKGLELFGVTEIGAADSIAAQGTSAAPNANPTQGREAGLGGGT